MKRFFIILIATIIVLSLCACDNASSVENSTDNTTAYTSPTETTAPTNPTSTTQSVAPTEPENPTVPTEPDPTTGIYEGPPIGEAQPDTFRPRVAIYYPMNGSGQLMQIFHDIPDELFPGMEITIEYYTNVGNLTCGRREEHKVLIRPNHNAVDWGVDFDTDAVYTQIDNGGGIFVTGIIRAGEYIIGYFFHEITYTTKEDTDLILFFPARHEVVLFPMVDGQMQQISLEYIVEKEAAFQQTVTIMTFDEMKAIQDAYWANKNNP